MGNSARWDEHFDTNKSYASFNEKSRTLIVRTAHYLPGNAHYCVSAIDVITLAEALVVSRLWHTGESETALEQSWLLVELHERFQLSLEELARRFTRSVSWLSRRLALVRELPKSIQERVRRGEIVAHAAEKYLVPLARANQQACLRLVEGVGSFRLSSRDMAVLYAAYRDGNTVTRQRLLEAPVLFLKAFMESQTWNKSRTNWEQTTEEHP